jgi:hypothetical protein
VNFRQLREEYFQIFGKRVLGTGAVNANQANIISANRYINLAIKKVVVDHDFPFLRTEGRVRLREPYDTGTITVVQDSATITGAATVWVRSMEGQLIDVNGEEHRVRDVISNTSIRLEDPVIQTGAAGLSYTITFDVIKLPRDLVAFYHARQKDTPAELWAANTFEEVQFFLLFDTDQGEVTRVDLDFLATERDFYTTGTVTVTNDSATVTGAGTSFSTQDIDHLATFRLADDDREYRILSVDSATQLTLTENYRGSTAATQNYVVDPAGVRRGRIMDYPESDQYAIFEYKRAIPILVADTDTPAPIPPEFHESVILNRAIYEGMKNRNLEGAERWLRDSNEAAALMKMGSNLNHGRSGHRIRRMTRGGRRTIGTIRANQTSTDAP